MFVAMNRFKIVPGKEEEFIRLWKERDSYLGEVPGFKSFSLLQGKTFDDYTLFASHSTWESEKAFEDWTYSEVFKIAHAHAGEKTRDIYVEPPRLELFNAVI